MVTYHGGRPSSIEEVGMIVRHDPMKIFLTHQGLCEAEVGAPLQLGNSMLVA